MRTGTLRSVVAGAVVSNANNNTVVVRCSLSPENLGPHPSSSTSITLDTHLAVTHSNQSPDELYCCGYVCVCISSSLPLTRCPAPSAVQALGFVEASTSISDESR